jgi:hypothetical protein
MATEVVSFTIPVTPMRMPQAQDQLERAQHVLWYFGDEVLGRQPGAFTAHLLRAFGVADRVNFARLFEAFPEYGVPFHMVAHEAHGLDELRGFVKDGLF